MTETGGPLVHRFFYGWTDIDLIVIYLYSISKLLVKMEINVKKTAFWIYLILVAVWMIVIFLFSAKDADTSSDTSCKVGMAIGRMFVPGFEEMTDAEQLEFAQSIDKPVRKTAHACEYAMLGFLVMGMCIAFNRERFVNRRKMVFLCAWMISILYAVSDEIHQAFVPGRACRFLDVCIDSAGALVGVLAGILFFRLINHRSFSKRKNNTSQN